MVGSIHISPPAATQCLSRQLSSFMQFHSLNKEKNRIAGNYLQRCQGKLVYRNEVIDKERAKQTDKNMKPKYDTNTYNKTGKNRKHAT